MKSWRLLFFISLYLFFPSSDLRSQEPKVFNVKFSQRPDSKVVVTYDLLGNTSKKYSIKLSLRRSGSRGQLPISSRSLSGAIGENVFPGRGLRIIWNLLDDYPLGLKLVFLETTINKNMILVYLAVKNVVRLKNEKRNKWPGFT